MKEKFCRRCKSTHLIEFFYIRPKNKGYSPYCIPCMSEWRKENTQYRETQRKCRLRSYGKLRLKALDKLGNQCVCCREASPQFLTIDHVKGGGREERKKCKTIALFKKILLKGADLTTYRVLCHNCNTSMGYYGYCPHAMGVLPTSDDKEEADFGEDNLFSILSDQPLEPKFKEQCSYTRSRVNSNREGYSAKKRRLKVKQEVFALYGLKCTCCTEPTPEFLTIDHVEGGGNIARKQRSSQQLYLDLRREGKPLPGYQLLCANCNQAKHIYGTCPHIQESENLPVEKSHGEIC